MRDGLSLRISAAPAGAGAKGMQRVDAAVWMRVCLECLKNPLQHLKCHQEHLLGHLRSHTLPS